MRKTLLILGVLAAPLYTIAADKAPDTTAFCQAGTSAVLEINGSKLALSDLEQKSPSALFQARNAYYEAERKAIDQFADQEVLQEQAKKESLTVDQLLEKHVMSTLPKDPAEEALHVYYEGVDTTQPYEAVRPQILAAIRQRRIARAKTAYIQSLRAQAKVAILLPAPRAEISLAGAPIRGAAHAPVTVVEYADYECPYCQQAQPALTQLEKDYNGKVDFVYKDYPLPMHSHAEKAAEASRCAEAQGKYWEYHDLLFTSKELAVPALKESARKVNLDGKAFDTCLDSGSMAKIVKATSDESEALGIQGTPTLFINGRFFNGALSYDNLRAAVDEELRKTEPGPQIAHR